MSWLAPPWEMMNLLRPSEVLRVMAMKALPSCWTSWTVSAWVTPGTGSLVVVQWHVL